MLGRRYFCIFGPDLSGDFGTLHGIGGLEATISIDRRGRKVTHEAAAIRDFLGNVLGHVDGKTSSINWSPTATSAYGPAANTTVKVFGEDTNKWIDAVSWRGYSVDPTGFIHMGEREYNYQAGRFISTDPLGHAASADLYSAFNCDPINFVDPTGRVAWFGAMAIGGGVGSLVGGTVGGFTAWFYDGDIQAGIVAGATAGAITGSGLGLLGVTTVGTGTAVAGTFAFGSGGAVIGDTAGQITQNINQGQSLNQAITNIDMQQQAISGLVGGTLAVVSSATGKALERVTNDSVTSLLETGSKYVSGLNRGGASQKIANQASDKIINAAIRVETIGVTAGSVATNPLVSGVIDSATTHAVQSGIGTTKDKANSVSPTGKAICN